MQVHIKLCRYTFAVRNRMLSTLLPLLLLVGCATPPIDAINKAPPGDPTLADARARFEDFRDRRVRWGGTIVAVENRASDTQIEIVARALDDYGRPRSSGESLGRFFARVEGFLDPAVYARDREITVAGTTESKLKRSVGDFPYEYVVVRVDTRKLWEPRIARPYHRDPYYDPLYDPFWPGRFSPWYPWLPTHPYYPYWR